MSTQCEKAEIALRRREVARAKLRGVESSYEIVKWFAENDPPIVNPHTKEPWDDSTIRRDLVFLSKEWKAEAARDTDAHKARLLEEIREAKREAWQQKDMTVLVALINREAKLMGLDSPEKRETTGKDGAPLFPPGTIVTRRTLQEDGTYADG